jgi:rhomboid protease GluP
MNERAVKIRLLFVPYLVISLSFIIVYTFLHWLLVVKLNLFSLKEIVLTLFLPMILPWIPVTIWMWPRIKLFAFKDADRRVFFYAFVAAAFITGCTCIMQEYMISATGNITHLKNIDSIYSQPETKFYSLDSYYLKKQHARFHFSFNTSGKYNHTLNFHCYIVVPVYATDPGSVNFTDTSSTQIRPVDYIDLYPDDIVINSAPKAWVGVHFTDNMPNKAGEDEKQHKWEQFRISSINRFDILRFPRYQYFERIATGDTKRHYQKAIRRIKDFPKLPHPYNILLPRENDFENRDNRKLTWLAVTFTGGMLLWLLMISLPKISREKANDFIAGRNRSFVFDRDVLTMITPRRNYLATPLLLYTNVVLFLIMWFVTGDFSSFNSYDLREWGASYQPGIADGQWWRLVTAMFLHGGIIHLFLNMTSLIIAGIFLEHKAGSLRFLFVFILSGIAGNIVSMFWHNDSTTVGASGAIFGLYGMFISFALSKNIFGGKSPVLLVYGGLCFIGINLLIGLIPGIDNAAHIGGLICGFLLGFPVASMVKRN